jgi:hypothetical protein
MLPAINICGIFVSGYTISSNTLWETKHMQAQRIVTKADASGHLPDLPILPPGQTVEVIMLMIDNNAPTHARRNPPSRLKGKIRETGDIFSTASSQDWNLS